MGFFSWIGGWVQRIKTAWPYVSYYLANAKRIDKLIDEALAIAEDFRRKNPAVPEAAAPDHKDVLEAVADSVAGKTGTPKKVKEWTPQEWQNYWNRGRETGGA